MIQFGGMQMLKLDNIDDNKEIIFCFLPDKFLENNKAIVTLIFA